MKTPFLTCAGFIVGTFCLRTFIVKSASCDLHRSNLSRFLHGCCDPATHRQGRKDTQVRKMGTYERVWGVCTRHEGCWTRGHREGHVDIRMSIAPTKPSEFTSIAIGIRLQSLQKPLLGE